MNLWNKKKNRSHDLMSKDVNKKNKKGLFLKSYVSF